MPGGEVTRKVYRQSLIDMRHDKIIELDKHQSCNPAGETRMDGLATWHRAQLLRASGRAAFVGTAQPVCSPAFPPS